MTDSSESSDKPRESPRGGRLADAEHWVLDLFSGTTENAEAYREAVERTALHRSTTVMPQLPHIDAVIAALATAGQNTEPVMVRAFVDNATVEVPGTEETFLARDWLESGRPPEPVLRLAAQMEHGQ